MGQLPTSNVMGQLPKRENYDDIGILRQQTEKKTIIGASPI